jgi:pimeloyl-ACP methyl ester carboxylesterase
MRAMLPHMWRFWYQWLILSPVLGYRLHHSGKFVPKVLYGATTDKSAWEPEAIRSFAGNLAEPARARAAVQMYRIFNLRESWQIIRGRYAKQRLTVPTLMLFGTDDTALRPEILAGYENHADEMELELVPGCGHFIADERPDLVAERAREFLA